MKIPKLSTLIESKKLAWVNSHITDTLFPAPKELRTDYKLFHFDRYISSEDAVKEMLANGYDPANAWELLEWKEWNEEDWVVALGSVGEVNGSRYVPGLSVGVDGRGLGIVSWGGGWGADYCRFLAVRNSELGNSEPQKSDLRHLDSWTLGQLDAIEEIIKSIRNHK